jgi:hypothetical protein
MVQGLQPSWPADSIDAISILASGSQFSIVGTEADQVSLESERGAQFLNELAYDTKQGWLQIHSFDGHFDGGPFVLRLPRKKAWNIDLCAGWGELEIRDVAARLQIALGKGNVRVVDCRGVISVSSGQGNVLVENFTEQAVPARPPMPAFETPFAFYGPGKSWPQVENPWNWMSWDPDEWSEWGMQFGHQMRDWGQKFGQMFNGMEKTIPDAGITVNLSHGDASLRQITAKGCCVSTYKGNLKLERGAITDLILNNFHGELECNSILPGGSWMIKSNHGDLRLALPADTQARIDAATRNGDIRSDIPLVRVPRPGPDSGRGVRMVGSIGQPKAEDASSTAAQITLSARHAHIEIRLQKERSSVAPQAEPQTIIVTPPPVQPVANPPVSQAAPGTSGDAAAITTPIPADEVRPTRDAQQLAILQALSEGAISVEEAERLLTSL